MNAQLLYDALLLCRNHFKPMEIWDKMSYSSQLLYCEQSIKSGAYKKFPESVVFHVENDGAFQMTNSESTVTT